MSRKIHFLRNVLWNWAEVGLGIFAALILAPIIIRRLGDEDYGMWALTMSLVEYYWLLDFGLRGATIKYTAHYTATGERDKVNAVINSSMVFSAVLAPLVVISVLLLAPYLAARFQVQRPELFAKLIILAVSSWALGTVGSAFSASLEGLQRFDYSSKAFLLTTVARNFGTLALLLLGYGVLEMAYLTFASQALLVTLSLIFLKRAFPEYRLAPSSASRASLRELFSYGVHGATASVGQRVLNQCTPLLTGYMLSAKATGYYTAPSKLVDYSLEAISRIGVVSNPNAAGFMARGDYGPLRRMAIDVSRYSLTLYMPATLFLMIYGQALLSVWISPEFAANCEGVLPALLTGGVLAYAAQYSSGSILFGMGKHQTYSRMLLLEAALTVAGTILVLPVYGIAGAAWVKSIFMLANRGMCGAYLLNRELRSNLGAYLISVYGPPIAIAVPVAGLLWWLRETILPGANWVQLIGCGAVAVVLYFVLAYHFCLRPEHRVVFHTVTSRILPSGH
jgi:O-antigen/teichoic acid export membrane protein